MNFDSYPIEVALVKGGINKSWLIKPESNWTYWSVQAESLHGIKRETLLQEGIDAGIVVDEINAFLADEFVVYSDAPQWDDDWINILYFAVGKTKSFYVHSVYELMSEQEKLSFESYRQQFVEAKEFNLHRAKDDALMLSKAYRLLRSNN